MKSQNLLKSIFGVTVIATLLSIMPCDAANPPTLVGHWLQESGSERSYEDMELFKDGTGVIEGEISISWKVENKRFIIQSSLFARASDYKISGSRLTLTYNDGESATYIERGQLERERKKKEAEREIVKKKAIAAVKKSSFTDPRNGKKYKTVKIGKQTWMAENLNYDAKGSVCYENDPANCQKYGRLYDYSTAMKACPSGWHLPSGEELSVLLSVLMAVVGEEKTEGKYLKATSGWNDNEDDSGNGLDLYGFAALPGGNGDFRGNFLNVGNYGLWWSTSEIDANYAFFYFMGYDGDYTYGKNDYKSSLFSVRCLEGEAKREQKEELDPTNPESIRKHYAKMDPPVQMSYDKFVSYVLKEDIANMDMFLVCSKDYLNTPNGSGNTALSMAVNKKKTAIVKYLLNKGADINIKSEQLDLTPLEDAATREDSTVNGIFSMLIGAQKKKDPKLHNIGTALHMASRYGTLKNVQILVENGANPNAKSVEGYTPLHEAAKYGRKPVVEYLLSKKVEVNPKDRDGYTPIDWAEAMGEGSTYPEVAKVLKKAGGKHTPEWQAAQ